MEKTIHRQDEDLGETQSLYMVGEHDRRYGKEAWEALCG